MSLSIENEFPETETITAAIRFINSTASHIFLTGKAGTGKTTFLRNLAKRTHKQFVVVAPTGIAALNAGGVTVHSQFLFPFGMFLPDRSITEDFNASGNYYTANTLARKHPLNSLRKQVLRSIDLLVIDEVSMLRADLLDAIDYRLKAAKSNFRESFGGVQLLLIGDLYQLPPVLKREEEAQLKPYYKSPWFFESKALQQDGFTYIELDKIFRQRDDFFIDLLNNLRNNKPTRQDIEELNKHYKPSHEIQNLQEVITLTTHNRKADELNQKALGELKGKSYTFDASLEGEFPENMYPLLQRLELKEGAQIMFTKNDNEGKAYFNGKLATVISISDDEIEVSMAETHTPYTLKKEVWENKKYTVNTFSKELDDEVIGTFEQYPVKLAWAITVHKSQGLTFDKAIIDVGEAFADGQVYVALSRLRSLDGLILRTHIDPNVISTDRQVVSFSEENHRPDELPVKMKVKQMEYIHHLISKTFDFETLLKEIAYVRKNKSEALEFEEETMKPVLEQISITLSAETDNTQKFKRQLISLLHDNQREQLLERIKKGSDYYKNVLLQASKKLLHHLEEMKKQKRVKGYVTSLTDIDQLFSKKAEEVDKALYLTEAILEDRDHFDFAKLRENRTGERAKLLEEIRKAIGVKPVKEKKSKGVRGSTKKKDGEPSTYDITFKMIEQGISMEDIAKERDLAVGTIEAHFAKLVAEERVSIFKLMSKENVMTIASAIKDLPEGSTSKDLFDKFHGRFGYGALRAVMSYTTLTSLQEKEE
ncbi:MAG TPA: AAA family ATPase [Chryseolinea sp.]|nr:AAA family ATPase [Chryseolinea sp.]HPH46069.1 AAA family ATPase [Chryseolinea sp.]HPM29748.1 AAA family ATPase [Chryseolinea sp.]